MPRAHPDGGFAWLDDDGRPELDRPVELWITCRMTHVFALAHLMGRPDAAELVDHGIAALTGRLRDAEHGGWCAAVDADGPVDAVEDGVRARLRRAGRLVRHGGRAARRARSC